MPRPHVYKHTLQSYDVALDTYEGDPQKKLKVLSWNIEQNVGGDFAAEADILTRDRNPADVICLQGCSIDMGNTILARLNEDEEHGGRYGLVYSSQDLASPLVTIFNQHKLRSSGNMTYLQSSDRKFGMMNGFFVLEKEQGAEEQILIANIDATGNKQSSTTLREELYRYQNSQIDDEPDPKPETRPVMIFGTYNKDAREFSRDSLPTGGKTEVFSSFLPTTFKESSPSDLGAAEPTLETQNQSLDFATIWLPKQVYATVDHTANYFVKPQNSNQLEIQTTTAKKTFGVRTEVRQSHANIITQVTEGFNYGRRVSLMPAGEGEQGFFQSGDFEQRLFSPNKKDDVVVLFGGNVQHLNLPGTTMTGQALFAGPASCPKSDGSFAFPITTQDHSIKANIFPRTTRNASGRSFLPSTGEKNIDLELAILEKFLNAGGRLVIPCDNQYMPSMPGERSHDVFRKGESPLAGETKDKIRNLVNYASTLPPTDDAKAKLATRQLREFVTARAAFLKQSNRLADYLTRLSSFIEINPTCSLHDLTQYVNAPSRKDAFEELWLDPQSTEPKLDFTGRSVARGQLQNSPAVGASEQKQRADHLKEDLTAERKSTPPQAPRKGQPQFPVPAAEEPPLFEKSEMRFISGAKFKSLTDQKPTTRTFFRPTSHQLTRNNAGDKFDFSTTALQSSESKKAPALIQKALMEAYAKVKITESARSYEEKEFQKTIALVMILAIKHGGVGNKQSEIKADLERFDKTLTNQFLKLAVEFSRAFQDEAGKRKLRTGNQNATGFVSMRLKRVTPDAAMTFMEGLGMTRTDSNKLFRNILDNVAKTSVEGLLAKNTPSPNVATNGSATKAQSALLSSIGERQP
jgi:hypothetical protein